jgi:hypothetical protein
MILLYDPKNNEYNKNQEISTNTDKEYISPNPNNQKNIRATIELYTNKKNEAWALLSLEERCTRVNKLAIKLNSKNQIEYRGIFSTQQEHLETFNRAGNPNNYIYNNNVREEEFFYQKLNELKLDDSKKRIVEKGTEYLINQLPIIQTFQREITRSMNEVNVPEKNFETTLIYRTKNVHTIPDSYYYDTPQMKSRTKFQNGGNKHLSDPYK